MIRLSLVGAIIALFVHGAPIALAKSDRTPRSQKTTEKTVKEEKAVAGGTLLETFGDWMASVAPGKIKTCYALAKPKDRSPDGKRGPTFIFIADRPAEKVRGEVSFIMGFPIKEGSVGKASIGKTSFDLVAVSNAFFMKDPADNTHIVDTLKRGGVLIVKAPPAKGPVASDTYSLKGFKQALDRAQKECR